MLERAPRLLLQLLISLLQLQLQKSQYLQLGPSRGQYYGGSLPNVNQIGSGTVDLPFQVSTTSVPFPHFLPSGAFPGLPPGTHPLWASVCVCDGCCRQLGSADNCHSPPAPHPLTPFLSLGWPGQASPRSAPPPVPCQHQQTLQQGLSLASSVSAATTPVGRLCGSGNRLGPLGFGSISLTNPQAQRFSEGGPEA